jgi:hypothetical protein
LADAAKITGCRGVHLLTEGGAPDYANSANRIFLRFKFGQWHILAMKRFVSPLCNFTRDIPIGAKGVETAEQFEILQTVGVDLVQGYRFGRPVPHSELDFDIAVDFAKMSGGASPVATSTRSTASTSRSTACTQGKRTQHGKPHGVVSDDQPNAREGQVGRLGVAERFAVPLKPG